VVLQILATPQDVAAAAAGFISACAREAVAARNSFTLALSGGSTPWPMLNRLAEEDLPGERMHIVQVDERVAPDGSPDRNLTHIREQFTDRIAFLPERLHGMLVNCENLDDGASLYVDELNRIAGVPPVLDLVQLGLGSDGHTASLLPGDTLLDAQGRDVGITPPYQGRARMSLTYPIINRARNILWLIIGSGKARMLERLIRGDPGIPAGRVSQHQATIFTDIAISAGEIQTNKTGEDTC
jgi:6-phosphogluconolactonase